MYAVCLVKRNVYTLGVIPVPIVNDADVRTMLAKDEIPCAGCICCRLVAPKIRRSVNSIQLSVQIQHSFQ